MQTGRRTSVRSRLSWGFGLVLGIMLAVVVLTVLQLQAMARINERFATEDMQRLLQVQALTLYTEGAGNALLVLLNSPREQREREYATVDERNRRIDVIAQTLAEQVADPAQAKELQSLNTARQAYLNAFIHTVEQIEYGDLVAAQAGYNDRVRPAISEMSAIATQLIDRERQSIAQTVTENQRRMRWLLQWFVAAALLALATSLWAARRMTAQVVAPLQRMVSAAQRIGAGDFRQDIPRTQVQEVDQLGTAVNNMAREIEARESRILELAYDDPLTGLRNRTYLTRQTSEPHHQCRVLMLMDLARLKTINETLGFGMGDEVIQHMASRFAQVFGDAALWDQFGEPPVLARLSGATLAASFLANGRDAVDGIRHRLEAAMADPVRCGSHSVDLSVAFGLADCEGDTASMPMLQLLRNAEVALQAAKRQAVPAAWFNQKQEASRLGHLGLLSDLREATQSDQLQMWLQPKVALATGQTVGFEALVRWNHPQRGQVSPGEFVPFAERTGVIRLVTRWMLRQAAEQLGRWRDGHPDWSIAVNLSTRDLQDDELCQVLAELLKQDGGLSSRLRLEITESGLMEDPEAGLQTLSRLRDLGFGLSIDDFGTGYSSLAYLQRLPVNELKIDRSFVQGLPDTHKGQHLFSAMVSMGHGLGLVVTAEGVESESEWHVIRSLGCDQAQGYLMGRPMHGEVFQNWLDAQTHQPRNFEEAFNGGV